MTKTAFPAEYPAMGVQGFDLEEEARKGEVIMPESDEDIASRLVTWLLRQQAPG